MLFKSKYHIPILNEVTNITHSIKLLITNDILFLPLAYQQTKASIGVNRVILYHIIIYVFGLKPQK